MTEWDWLNARGEVSVAIEGNGKATMGFMVELPGAFVRGRSEKEALAKVDPEAKAYLKWLQLRPLHSRYRGAVVQRHISSLMVDDADCEILPDADRSVMGKDEFESTVNLAR